jgi:hypothetical protein
MCVTTRLLVIVVTSVTRRQSPVCLVADLVGRDLAGIGQRLSPGVIRHHVRTMLMISVLPSGGTGRVPDLTALPLSTDRRAASFMALALCSRSIKIPLARLALSGVEQLEGLYMRQSVLRNWRRLL